MSQRLKKKPKSKAANNHLAAQGQAKLQHALTLHQHGQLAQAQVLFEEILRVQPKHFIALNLLGVIAAQTKNPQRAVAFFDKAIASNPTIATFYFNRGLALQELEQHQASLANYDQAIALKPDYADAYYNRGRALQELKLLDTALANYDQAIALKSDSADAYNNRGIALQVLKQLDAALASYDQAIAIDPDYEFLQGQRLHTKMHLCDWRDAENQRAELSQRIQGNKKAADPFAVLALSTSLPLQRKAAETWTTEKYPQNIFLGKIPKHPRGAKICLGYYSSDFYNHATAYLMAELFEHHRRDQFEIIAFSFGPGENDEMRQRLAAAFDKFIEVRNTPDKEVALLSRELQIDIAVDLKGFTRDSKVGIFSYGAAPIQVNYLGYPGTMGADYIDYLIADKTLIPEESRQHYAEKIAYLPDSYQVNDTKRKIADKTFSREELALPASGFVFCCFNNNYKITPDTFDGWMRILKRVDGSVLWLYEDNPTAADNLRTEAAQRGVAAQRLVFAKEMPLPEHLARHRAADLFIDTLPYNAHTTASDALWAGLPVLTCTGEAFAGRVAASLLTAIDLPELITATQEEYEALAVELATNPARLNAIKQKLERNRLTTPLFDSKLFTKHIEDAYTQMYERYHADLPPDHIFVEPN